MRSQPSFRPEEMRAKFKFILTDDDLDATNNYRNDPNFTIESTQPLNVWAPTFYDMKTTEYGFSSSYSNNNTARTTYATDYAMANYAFKVASNYRGNTYYWTSSTYSNSYAFIVGNQGNLSGTNYYYPNYAVRPAILYNL